MEEVCDATGLLDLAAAKDAEHRCGSFDAEASMWGLGPHRCGSFDVGAGCRISYGLRVRSVRSCETTSQRDGGSPTPKIKSA